MHIRLGLQLDGQRGDLVHSELDAQTTGPLGFLNVLETQLGLLRLEPSTSDRILQVREILARLDGPNRFLSPQLRRGCTWHRSHLAGVVRPVALARLEH
jgi:hypothetical protein